MKQINKLTVLLIIMCVNGFAAPVGTIFSYQGQLKSDGSPANGVYDLKMELWNSLTGGTNLPAQIYEDVQVSNGLFSIQIDFGDTPFVGDAKFLKIQVREGTSTGAFTQLFPRQRINAVPYAIQSEFVENSSSPWLDAFTGIQYNGDIVIGNLVADAEDTLQLVSDPGDSPLRVIVDTQGTRFRVSKNGGTGIGSNFTDGQIPNNGLHVNGNVEIGVSVGATTSKLTIDADAAQSPVRFKIAGATSMIIGSNGGTTIGANSLAPNNGLRIIGDTQLNGDLKQDVDNYGSIKAGLRFTCGNSATTIHESFNNINNSSFTVTSNLPEDGRCEISFPFDINSIYFQASVHNANFIRGVTCAKTTNSSNNDIIVCNGYNALNSTRSDVIVTLLIF